MYKKKKSRQRTTKSTNGLLKLRECVMLVMLLCIALLYVLLVRKNDNAEGALYMLGAAYSSGTSSADSLGERISIQRTEVDPGVSDNVIIELKGSREEVFPLSMNSDEPTILIYHTHTLEAYTPSDKYPYEERGGDWRTNDNTCNIVTVGELLTQELRKRGFNVLHDTTNHEPPKLSTSYSRSEATMKKYKEKYPTLEMFIDVHRDASGKEGATDYCVIDGVKTARMMFVVGTGEGATGSGFDEMPDFESNYALAMALTEYMSDIDEGLMRDVRVKTGRYNQHISNRSLLVEVGHNMNTLEQALAAVMHLADAIEAVCAE